MRGFSVVVERDDEGFYVASVPALPGCHTQAKSLDKVERGLAEADAGKAVPHEEAERRPAV